MLLPFARGVDSSLFPQAPTKSRFRFFSRVPSKRAAVLARFSRPRCHSVQNTSPLSGNGNQTSEFHQTREFHCPITDLTRTIPFPHVSAITVWLAIPSNILLDFCWSPSSPTTPETYFPRNVFYELLILISSSIF